MIQTTLTKHQTKKGTPIEQLFFSSFAQNSPNAYAIFNRNLSQLSCFNPAFLQVMRCDAFSLEGVFPSNDIFDVSTSKFVYFWEIQLERLRQLENINFEWQLESRFGERRILRFDLWNIGQGHQELIGIKVEDITTWKQLANESQRFVKII